MKTVELRKVVKGRIPDARIASTGTDAAQLDREIEEVLRKPSGSELPAKKADDQKRPWYFEKTGPSFFNAWSLTHIGWGALFQLVFPDRYVTGLVVHTIYESIEGYIFPAEFRDVSMRNHVGDTAAFAAGMLMAPSPSKRLHTDTAP